MSLMMKRKVKGGKMALVLYLGKEGPTCADERG
jgi:hypothetical protein